MNVETLYERGEHSLITWKGARLGFEEFEVDHKYMHCRGF